MYFLSYCKHLLKFASITRYIIVIKITLCYKLHLLENQGESNQSFSKKNMDAKTVVER
jgi:hypothetical protein